MSFANNKGKKLKYSKENEVSMKEYLAAKQELEELQKEYGIEPTEPKSRGHRFLDWYFDKKENRRKVKVNRKKYLWMTILGGWFGLHRFVAKQYWVGTLYLVLCWSGFPLAMTLIDLLIIIPLPVDEDGNIEVL
ncbi:MAG: TM2 domain-containing protein [Clostridiales bacterium]|nr:TM2 domain-containing protein [Candidatus Blautia equi]